MTTSTTSSSSTSGYTPQTEEEDDEEEVVTPESCTAVKPQPQQDTRASQTLCMASDISDSCVASPGRAATAEPINQAGATAQICCERNPANDVSAHSSLVFEDIGGDASDDEDDIDEHNEATGTANPFDGSAGVHKTEDRGAAASEQPELLETLTSSSLLENTASMTCQASCTQEACKAHDAKLAASHTLVGALSAFS
eukprot:jgi/Chrzof1/1178/Cz01g43180.t1